MQLAQVGEQRRYRRGREAVGSRPEWRLATSGARDFAAAIASSFVIRAYYGAGVRRGRSRVDPGLSLPGSTRLRVESIVKKVPRQGTGEEALAETGPSPKKESPPSPTPAPDLVGGTKATNRRRNDTATKRTGLAPLSWRGEVLGSGYLV